MTDPSTRDLLVELGCEELPPKALAALTRAFFESTCKALEDSQIGFDPARSTCFYTPRRMTLLLSGVDDRQPDQHLDRKGPSVAAAFDAEGKPTPAALGFARSVERPVDALDRLETDKGEWLFCRVELPGKPLAELLYPILESALAGLPVPKPMRWSDHDFSFVRPVHWLLVLHGDQVLEGELYGLPAGRQTRGHRIHSPGPHDVASPDEYVMVLREARVLVDQDERLDSIRESAARAGQQVGGCTRMTEALLAEVNNLVEWPVALTCRFDRAFLEVPAEALVASMESHQKFFPVLSTSDGELTEHFIVIANLESQDPDLVRAGYERVVRPRLADADFFWRQDLKSPLASHISRLDSIVFQENLGSLGDKSRRLAALSKKLEEIMGETSGLAERAALLSKCDLVSLMVGEFPELQGTMGAHYARAANEPDAVAEAIGSHYQPRFAGDAVPPDTVGRVVALADRLDTLVGVFAAGIKPTGNKDPFALRRAALGVIRILLEGQYAVPIDDLLALTAEGLAGTIDVGEPDLLEVRSFVLERLRQHLRDQGYGANAVQSVLSAPLHGLPDLVARLEAVKRFMRQEEAQSLVSANKRIGNIIKNQDLTRLPEIEEDLFKSDQERRLFGEVTRLKGRLDPLFSQGDYASALSDLATLREPVDDYFEQVMIMDEDLRVRNNRLAQLIAVKSLFDRVADFSQAE